ncbi:MAG: hypothetical protein AAB628_00760 [Patescibacteria group bacterium]
MNPFTKEQLEHAYDLLTEETQGMLFGPTIESAVQKIGKEFGFNSDQLVTLSSLVNFTIMGLIKKEAVPSEILKILTASAEKTSREISSKIDSEILVPTSGAVVAKPEAVIQTPSTPSEILQKEASTPAVLPTIEPKPVLVPENLPTNETPATPAIKSPEESTEKSFVPNNEARSSFEEKMKQSFVETSVDLSAGSSTGTTARVDPYREPIG